MIIFLRIIAAVLFIGSIIATVLYYLAHEEIKKKYLIIPNLIAFVLLVTSCSFKIIPTGYTGVKTTFGQINETTLNNGFNWNIPFVQSIETVNNKQQDIVYSGKIWSETSGRTTIYYDEITVTYQINSEKSAWIFANVSNYEDDLISQNLVASAVKSSSKTLADTEATNRSIIEPLVQKNIQKSLDEKYGEKIVYINKVVINNTDFEDSYNEAIAAKQKAQLKAEKQEIENKKEIEKAKADALVTKTKAQAEADAKVIAAKAELEANKLLDKSLTDHILKKKYIERWNGSLPQYISGNNDSFMFGINK